MRTKETSVAMFPIGLAEAIPDTISAQLARIVSLTSDGVPEVQVGGAGPVVRARWAFRATRERIEAAIADRQQAVVIFENGDRLKPLVVGFVEALESNPRDVPDPSRDPSSAEVRALRGEAERRSRPDKSEGMPVIEADVDGRRVRVTAQDEIVLQCGSASVTLRRNGRVVIRGSYVETHSEGTNRITGGQVRIN